MSNALPIKGRKTWAQPEQDYWWNGCYGTPAKGFSWLAQGMRLAKEQAAAQQAAEPVSMEITSPAPDAEGA
ncbi:hypothetical protein M1D80_11035 [Phyllobacteriaceae bacterium JZ32]